MVADRCETAAASPGHTDLNTRPSVTGRQQRLGPSQRPATGNRNQVRPECEPLENVKGFLKENSTLLIILHWYRIVKIKMNCIFGDFGSIQGHSIYYYIWESKAEKSLSANIMYFLLKNECDK